MFDSGNRFQKLDQRVRTALNVGLVLIVILVIAKYLPGGRWLRGFCAAAVVSWCSWEFARVCGDAGQVWKRTIYPLLLAGPVWFVMISEAVRWNSYSLAQQAILTIVLLSSMVTVVAGRSQLTTASQVGVELLVGVVLLAWGGTALTALSLSEDGWLIMLWALLVIIASDSAAYFGGSYFQGPKLAPAISPKKTVTGAVSGLMAGGLIGMVFSRLISSELNDWWMVLIVGLAVAVVGQIGDLLKSLVKRLMGVKDMGSVFPGHGGMLDRVDGLLAASGPLMILFGI